MTLITRRSLPLLTAVGACLAAGVANAGARRMHVRRPGRRDVAHMMDVAHAPALSFALIENGAIAETAVLGFRREAEPATAQTYFASASLMKPVFATAILALADQHVIDLDRPLQSYLPLFEDLRAQKITARHVLSHTTGLTNWNYSPQPLTAAFEPGTQWGYSGEAHFLLLRVAEHLSAKPLGALLDEYVFRPAGMRHSTVDWTDEVAADNAWPHDNDGALVSGNSTDQGICIARAVYGRQIGSPMSAWTTEVSLRACEASHEHPYPGNAEPNAAFGLWTTAEDYARFLIFAAQDARRAAPQIRMRGNVAWGLGWGLEIADDGPSLGSGAIQPGSKHLHAASANPHGVGCLHEQRQRRTHLPANGAPMLST